MKKPVSIRQGQRIRYDGPDREWLEYQYLTLDKSTVELSQEFGMSRHAIAAWLKKHDIVKPKKKVWARHSDRMSGSGNPAWNGGTARNYHKRLTVNRLQVCEWCGTVNDIQVHHRDHDAANGDPANLALLCGTCNRLEAHLWALQESGRANILVDERKILVSFK